MTQVSLAAQAQQCSSLFRLGRDVEAVMIMVEVCSDVQPLISGANVELQARWTAMLTAMLGCQETQNWLALADYLEYELIELLEVASAA